MGNELGATATYSCFPGYILAGDDIRLCLKSGEWSGAPPTCEGEETCKMYAIVYSELFQWFSAL